jgi:hypothetical protein
MISGQISHKTLIKSVSDLTLVAEVAQSRLSEWPVPFMERVKRSGKYGKLFRMRSQ